MDERANDPATPYQEDAGHLSRVGIGHAHSVALENRRLKSSNKRRKAEYGRG